MTKASPDTDNPSFVALGFVTAIVLMFVISTTLILGSMCKYVTNMCKKLCARRKKKRSKKEKPREETQFDSRMTFSQKSLRTLPPGSTVIKHQFSIPKTKSEVLAQPTFSQRMRKSSTDDEDEREARLVSMYYTEKALGKLDPEQYQQCQQTVTVGVDYKLGDINVIVRHNTRNRKLQVIVVCGRDYPPRDYSGSLDTCVTLCLLPDREHRKQTAIHRRSVNPQYNESFEFNLYDEDAYSRSLQLVAFYYDQYSHSHVLGEVQVPLIDYDLSGETSIWCHLHEVSAHGMQKLGSHAEVGDLLLSLCFTTKDQTLTVAIMKVCNLLHTFLASSAKIYAKASLKRGGNLIRKRKTNLREVGHQYTVFNEALLFRVPREVLDRCTLKVALSHYNVVGKSSTIGEVTFTADEKTGPAASHWSDMLSKPNKPTAMWHTIHGFKFLEQREVEKPLSPSE